MLIICNRNAANIDVVVLYLSERLYNIILYTREINFFSSYIYIFFSSLFCQSVEKFVKCSHEREDRFYDSQSFHFYESSKVQSMYITSVWIFIFPSYQLYKIVRISVICCSPRAGSKYAIIRPQQHGFSVLTSSMPILSLLVFNVAIFWSVSSYAKNRPRINGQVIMMGIINLYVEFGENLAQLQPVGHKLFCNLTFYRSLFKIGISDGCTALSIF